MGKAEAGLRGTTLLRLCRNSCPSYGPHTPLAVTQEKTYGFASSSLSTVRSAGRTIAAWLITSCTYCPVSTWRGSTGAPTAQISAYSRLVSQREGGRATALT